MDSFDFIVVGEIIFFKSNEDIFSNFSILGDEVPISIFQKNNHKIYETTNEDSSIKTNSKTQKHESTDPLNLYESSIFKGTDYSGQ